MITNTKTNADPTTIIGTKMIFLVAFEITIGRVAISGLVLLASRVKGSPIFPPSSPPSSPPEVLLPPPEEVLLPEVLLPEVLPEPVVGSPVV